MPWRQSYPTDCCNFNLHINFNFNFNYNARCRRIVNDALSPTFPSCPMLHCLLSALIKLSVCACLSLPLSCMREISPMLHKLMLHAADVVVATATATATGTATGIAASLLRLCLLLCLLATLVACSRKVMRFPQTCAIKEGKGAREREWEWRGEEGWGWGNDDCRLSTPDKTLLTELLG